MANAKQGKDDRAEQGDSKLNRVSKATNIAFNTVFVVLSVVFIIPFIFVIMISVTSESSLATYGYQLIPKELSADSYLFLWGERITIAKALGISTLVTVVGTAVGVVLTSMLGYSLSRSNYKLKSFFTWVVFIPMIFNGGMVASYVVNVNILQLRNSIWALILPLAVSPFNIIICRTFFQTTIPDSVIESAKIDGATQMTVFWRIVIPLAKPVLATVALFLAFGYWNDWFLSSLYISESNLVSLQALLNNIQKNIEYMANNPTAGLSLAQYKSSMPKESARMAIAVLIVIPIACAYPFFQKYFISGLTIGAVKG